MESQIFGTEFENLTREWEAKQNDKGVFYYVNSTKQKTSWNHPYFNKILEDLSVYGNIKYAAYRTSLKLRYLQSHIGLDWIKAIAVKQTFAEHTQSTNTRLSYWEALSLILNVLHISNEQRNEKDIRTAADLILNLMMNLYDVDRCGTIGTRSLRNALITMCCSRLTEKYQYFFTAVSDVDQNVCKEKLLFLLDDLIQIPSAVKEGASFGGNVAGTVDSCFKAGDSMSGKVSSECFTRWLIQEPQTLVWLPTFHRILATETVEHNVRCNACGSVRIAGLRYRCLQCVRYQLCQNCFLQGQTSLSHTLKHPVREYCLPTSIKDSTKALLEILKNKLRRNRRRQIKTAYLPVKHLPGDGALTNWQPDSIHNSIASVSDSVDSGLAIGTDQQEADIEEAEVNRCNKTSEVPGEPSNASTPFMRESDQELVILSRRDIDNQQEPMEQQIEQLKKENRMLQSKLNLIYKYCDAELTNELSTIDRHGPGTSFDSFSKDLVKETLDISISPIVNNSSISSRSQAKENEHSSSNNGHCFDLRHIIGMLTPVRHTKLTSQTSQLSIQKYELSSPSQTFSRQNDSSVPDGLGYRSADMSLMLASTGDTGSQKKPDICELGLGLFEAASSSGLVEAPGEITLGSSEKLNTVFSEEERRALQSQNKHRPSIDRKLQNSSLNSSKFIAGNIVNAKLHLRKINEKKQLNLLYSSGGVKFKPSVYSSAADTSDSSCNSESFNSNVTIIDENHLTNKAFTSDDAMSVMLDEICDDSQVHSHVKNPTPSPTMYTLKQRLLGQVLMSTPVSASEHVTSRIFLRKQFQTMSLPRASDEEKENNVTLGRQKKSKHSQSISSIDMSHLSASSHRTSLRQKSKYSHSVSSTDASQWSAMSSPRTSARHQSNHSASVIGSAMSDLSASHSHRREAPTSVNLLLSSQSLDSINGTKNESDTGDLSSLFRKAEKIWNIVDENMPDTQMTNGDTLEKRMTDFKKECAADTSFHGGLFNSPRTVHSGSILTAVGNVGNAMANFVYTTEHCLQGKA